MASDYHRGEMDVTAQAETYKNVMVASKWASLAIAVGVLFFSMWFCTGAGFLGAFVTAIVVAVVGGFLLRGGPGH
jgi:hypothetical protein